MTTRVHRPALDIVQTGGSFTIVDADGNVQQIIGTQPDGTVGISNQNGTAPDAVSTPVVIEGTLGLTVTWDGLMAADMVGDALNANTDFEDGVDSWSTPGGGTIAQSSTEAHGGTDSLACKPDGTSAAMSATSELVAVTAGDSYEAACWVWPTDAVTANFSLSVDWFDSDRQALSTDATLVDLSAAEWSQVVNTVTAPDDAAFAQLHPTLSGTPTDVFYIDDISIGTASSSVPADFDHVAVHVSETSGFTPDSTTLQGTLRHAGNFPVTPLDGGTEYFVVLVGVNTSGVSGTASAKASGTPSEVVATSIEDGIVTTLKLADDAVTAAKIAAAAVGTTEIADDAVTTAKVVAGAIEADQLAAGSVETDKLAANAVTAAKIEALTITGDQIAANAITTGKINAGAVTADLLEATLVLGTQIVAGDSAGARVQLDDTGIAAYSGSGVQTVEIGSDGSATFNGSQVSASEVDASSVYINAGDSGALIMYGTTGSALNTNPDFATGITSWTNESAAPFGGVSYSSTHTFNGHDTMKLSNPGSFAAIDNASFSVASGSTYLVEVTALCESGMNLEANLLLQTSGGTNLSQTIRALPGPRGGFQNLSFTVTNDQDAAKAVLSLGGSGGANAIYVAKAAVSLVGDTQMLSVAPMAGTDKNGNAYPAGIATTGDLSVGGALSAGSFPFKWGGSTQNTATYSGTSTGQVQISHGLGAQPTYINCFPAVGFNSHYRFQQVIAHDASTFTVQVVYADTVGGTRTIGDPVANGQSLGFYWWAAV